MKAFTFRFKKTILTISILLLLYTLTGFVGIPLIVTKIVPKKAAEHINGSLEIESCYFNPYTFYISIEGAKLDDKESKTLLGATQLIVDFELWKTLVNQRLTLNTVSITKPVINFERDTNAHTNFQNLIIPSTEKESQEPAEPEKKEVELPALDIAKISIINGSFDFKDQSVAAGFNHTINPLTFDVTNFSTIPSADNPLQFFCKTNTGTELSWTGQLYFNPLSSEGTLSVKNFEPATYSAYYEQLIPSSIDSCSLDLLLNYTYKPVADVAEIKINDSAITLNDIALRNKSKKVPFKTMKSVELNGINIDLITGEVSLNELLLKDGELHLSRTKNNLINIVENFLPPVSQEAVEENTSEQTTDEQTQEKEETANTAQKDIILAIEMTLRHLAKLPKLTWQANLKHLGLHNQKIHWKDEATVRPVLLDIDSLNLDINNLANKQGTKAKINFSATLKDSGTIVITGEMSPDPAEVNLDYKLIDINLALASPYIEPFAAVSLTSGKFTTDGTVTAKKPEDIVSIIISGNVQIDDFNVQHHLEAQPKKLISWKTLQLSKYKFTSTPMNVTLDKLLLVEPQTSAELQKDGTINLTKLVPSNNEKTMEAPKEVKKEEQEPTNNTDFTAAINEISITNGSFTFKDETAVRPVKIDIGSLNLDINGLSNKQGSKAKINFSASLNDHGKVGLTGDISPSPTELDIKYKLSDIELPLASPYIEPHAAISLTSGKFATDGTVTAKKLEEIFSIATSGNASIDDLDIQHHLNAQPEKLISWESLQLAKYSFSSDPMNFTLNELRLDGPQTSVELSKDGKINLTKLVPVNDKKEIKASEPQEQKEESNVTAAINKISISNGSFTFKDESIGPGFTQTFKDLKFETSNISSDLNGDIPLLFTGKGVDGSKIALRGMVNPSKEKRKVDLSLTTEYIAMTGFTPYTKRFVGYPFDDGKLNINQHYTIDKNSLKGAIKVHIDTLELGKYKYGEDVVKVPLKIGLALLEDNDNQIDLPEIEIAGELDDPEFSIGRVIWYAVKNIFVKAATAPFSVLASTFGASEKELKQVIFEPNSTTLSEQETKKLSILATILQKRPTLTLEIASNIDKVKDLPKAKEINLRNKLEEMKTSLQSINTDKTNLSESELISHLFRKTFPYLNQAPPKPAAPSNSGLYIYGKDKSGDFTATIVSVHDIGIDVDTMEYMPDFNKPVLDNIESARTKLLQSLKVNNKAWEDIRAKRSKEVIKTIMNHQPTLSKDRFDTVLDDSKQAGTQAFFSIK